MSTTRLGRYELVERIAQGGMGEVFLAWQHGARGFRRPVIIKRIREDLVEREGAVELFLHEARLGALLRHANITQVLDLDEDGGTLFLAMELVEGPDLRTLTRSLSSRGETMPLALAAYVLARAAEGVAFAHAAVDPDTGRPLNLIHRDISPQNLLLSRLGDVKLTDFGIAKSAARTTETQAGFVRGRVGYMSPEQLAYEKVTLRTDVYALGVVLHEVLAGERLYAGLSEEQIVDAKVNRLAPPPSRKNPQVDEALDAIVLRAVATSPGDRYASALAFSEALDRWALGASARHDRRTLAGWLRANANDLGVRTTRFMAVATQDFGAHLVTAPIAAEAVEKAKRLVLDTGIEETQVDIDLSSVEPPAATDADTAARPSAKPSPGWELPQKQRGQARGPQRGQPRAPRPQPGRIRKRGRTASTRAPLENAEQPTVEVPALHLPDE